MLNFHLLLLAVFLLILQLLLLQCPRSKMAKNLERMRPPVHAPAVLRLWALDVYLLPLTSAAPVICKNKCRLHIEESGVWRDGWALRRSCTQTQLACICHYTFTLAYSIISPRHTWHKDPCQIQASRVLFTSDIYREQLCRRCFGFANMCRDSPVGMKAGCWSCMLARACW